MIAFSLSSESTDSSCDEENSDDMNLEPDYEDLCTSSAYTVSLWL